MDVLSTAGAGRLARPLTAAALLVSSSVSAHANEVPGYDFAAAAQEISQLFWLAETAHVCGWATQEDSDRFRRFSVRFLSAHLSERDRLALQSLVGASGYAEQVRRVAAEGAEENCTSSRWHLGWSSYREAADAHQDQF